MNAVEKEGEDEHIICNKRTHFFFLVDVITNTRSVLVCVVRKKRGEKRE